MQAWYDDNPNAILAAAKIKRITKTGNFHWKKSDKNWYLEWVISLKPFKAIHLGRVTSNRDFPNDAYERFKRAIKL